MVRVATHVKSSRRERIRFLPVLLEMQTSSAIAHWRRRKGVFSLAENGALTVVRVLYDLVVQYGSSMEAVCSRHTSHGLAAMS